MLIIASMMVFALLHIIPGDPAASILGEQATEEEVDQLREQLGLNDPLPVQLANWWGDLLQGDLGESFRTSRPVTEAVRRAAEPTIELAFVAYVLTLAIGIPLGVMAGVRTRSAWDWGLSFSTVAFIAVPNFVFGIVALWLIGLQLGWLPIGGRVAIWEDPVEGLKTIALPAITLGTTQAAILGRYTRTAVAQVMNQQFILAARAKGLQERWVVIRHALRNALIPTITISALQIAGILTGSVVIERVFSRPGLGRLVVDSIQSRDIPTVQGVLLVLVVVFIAVNLIADLMYGVVDPRSRDGS